MLRNFWVQAIGRTAASGFRFLACLAVCACTGTFVGDKIDPAGNLSRNDYIALRERGDPRVPVQPKKTRKGDEEKTDQANDMRADPNTDPNAPPPPEFIPSLIPPPPPLVSAPLRKRVSLNVTEETPVRAVLLGLAERTGISLALDPRIKGGVMLSVTDQPVNEVLARIADLAGLRIRDASGILRVELDEPFARSWTLSYPNLVRRMTSSTAVSTNVFDTDIGDTSNATTASSSDNNSTARISEQAEARFWDDVETSLRGLLIATPVMSPLGSPADSPVPKPASLTIDRQGGLITVTGTSVQHRVVDEWLKALQQRVTAQVLIEARIVEVELNDGFQSGINWRTLFDGAVNTAARFGTAGAGAPFLSATTAADGLFTASIKSGDLNAVLTLVRQFGTTRVLSSPRLTVLNNQTAILKVARNEVYFITSAQFPTSVSTGGVPISGTPVFSSTPRTVPVGFVMTVQPAIDTEQRRVTLTLRPTISRIVGRVSDPSIGLNANESRVDRTVESTIPVLAVRELDSVLQVNSGEVAVLGGLMEDAATGQENGVPPFDTLPVAGNLAKSRDIESRTSELVILLRATILDAPPPDRADRALYRGYMRDPRGILGE